MPRAPLIAAAILSSLVATAAAGGEVRIGKLKVAVGPRKAKAIKRAFAAIRATLAPCGDETSSDATEAVWVAIGTDGAAATLAPDGTTRFGACVAAAVATMKLPAAAAPTAVRVDLTFVSEAMLSAEAFADQLMVETSDVDMTDMSKRAPGADLGAQIAPVDRKPGTGNVGTGSRGPD